MYVNSVVVVNYNYNRIRMPDTGSIIPHMYTSQVLSALKSESVGL